MRCALAFAAFAGLAAAAPQAVATTLAPPSMASGCATTYSNGAKFQIGIVNASTSAAKLIKRQGLDPNSVPGNTLMLTLNNGQLLDQSGRIGYIASNDQLQFDNPIQAGGKITTGFSVCPNGTLALETAVWYECLSGNFYNLYDASQGAQCSPAYLQVVPEGGSAPPVTSVATGTVAITTTIRSTSAPALTQVSDGQPQATSGTGSVITSVAVLSPASSATATASAVITGGGSAVISGGITQITDGQVQAPTNATTLTPFNPNAAPAVAVSGTFLAVVAGAIGLSALFL